MPPPRWSRGEQTCPLASARARCSCDPGTFRCGVKLCGCCPSRGPRARRRRGDVCPPSGHWVKSPRVSSRTIRRHASLRGATRSGHAAIEQRDRMEELLIDDYIATQELMRRKGWRQHALHWPASAGLAPKLMAYCLLRLDHPSPQRAVSRAVAQRLNSTRHRLSSGAIRLGQRCIAGSVRKSFVAEPAGRPGLRLWGAPPQRWACFRVDQLCDKPRAAPEPQGPSRRTCHGRIQTLAEDQSRRKTGGGFCCWRPVGDLRRSDRSSARVSPGNLQSGRADEPDREEELCARWV